MARYDVFEYEGGDGLLLDVQTDLLDGLSTRIVAPLLPRKTAPKPAGRLNPVFTIGKRDYVMATQFLAAVPQKILKTPVANLAAEHVAIVAALDMAFHGF